MSDDDGQTSEPEARRSKWPVIALCIGVPAAALAIGVGIYDREIRPYSEAQAKYGFLKKNGTVAEACAAAQAARDLYAEARDTKDYAQWQLTASLNCNDVAQDGSLPADDAARNRIKAEAQRQVRIAEQIAEGEAEGRARADAEAEARAKKQRDEAEAIAKFKDFLSHQGTSDQADSQQTDMNPANATDY